MAGNATLDAHIEGRVYEIDNQVVVISDGVKRVFDVVDGPIRYGFKHRTNVDVEQHIRGLWNVLKPGGGGYNTATSIKRRTDIAINLNLAYIDVSEQDDLITQSLSELGISGYFFGLRPVPVNVILGGRGDKILLKGPMLPRVHLKDEHKETIDDLVHQANGVVINSAKDESLVDFLLQSSISRAVPLYFVVTSSLPSDFVLRRMLPFGTSILSHEDIVSIYGQNPLKLDDAQLFELSLEYLRKIRSDEVNKGNNIFVTLGPRGVLCLNRDGKIYHVILKEEYKEIVGYSAESRVGSTNGAGDTFAGAVVSLNSSVEKMDIKKIAMRASKASIRHIGYDGPIGYTSFNVRPYK